MRTTTWKWCSRPRTTGTTRSCRRGNNALKLNTTVPETVEACAHNGNITLAGTVRYGYQRPVAEETVAGPTGVRNVRDEIVIAWGANPVDVKASCRRRLTGTR